MVESLFGNGEGAKITRTGDASGGYYVALQDADTGTVWPLALSSIRIEEARDMASYLDTDGNLNATFLGEGKVSITMTGVTAPGCAGVPDLGDSVSVYRDTTPEQFRRVNLYAQSGWSGTFYRGFVTALIRSRSSTQAMGNETYTIRMVAVSV